MEHEGVKEEDLLSDMNANFSNYLANHNICCDSEFSSCKMPVNELSPTLSNSSEMNDDTKNLHKDNYLENLKNDLNERYRNWTQPVTQLTNIAEELRKDKKWANIIRISGSSVSIAGTIAAVVASIVASVLTGGLAAFITIIVGSAVSVAGGGTSVGAGLVAKRLSKKAKKKADEIKEKHTETAEKLQLALNQLKLQTKDRLQTFDKVVVRYTKEAEDRIKVTFVMGDVTEELGYVKSVTKRIETIAGEERDIIEVVTQTGSVISRIALGATAAARSAAFVVDDALRVIATGASVAGAVVGVAVIAVDIYTIVKTAIEMSNGSPDAAADKIMEYVEDLKRHQIPDIGDLIIQAQLEAANECGIPEEII